MPPHAPSVPSTHRRNISGLVAIALTTGAIAAGATAVAIHDGESVRSVPSAAIQGEARTSRFLDQADKAARTRSLGVHMTGQRKRPGRAYFDIEANKSRYGSTR